MTGNTLQCALLSTSQEVLVCLEDVLGVLMA